MTSRDGDCKRGEGPDARCLEPTRGLEAALTLTGPCEMHELTGDHKIPPECDCKEGELVLPGTAVWGPQEHLGSDEGIRRSNSDVHPTDGETEVQREKAGCLSHPASKDLHVVRRESARGSSWGDEGEAKITRHLPCPSSAPTLRGALYLSPHSLLYRGSNGSSEAKSLTEGHIAESGLDAEPPAPQDDVCSGQVATLALTDPRRMPIVAPATCLSNISSYIPGCFQNLSAFLRLHGLPKHPPFLFSETTG